MSGSRFDRVIHNGAVHRFSLALSIFRKNQD